MTIDQFPDVLRELRLAANLSQEALAHKAGLHRTYISQLERGVKSPTLKSVSQIASALGLSLEAIAQKLDAK